jgi:hypothetical protein
MRGVLRESVCWSSTRKPCTLHVALFSSVRLAVGGLVCSDVQYSTLLSSPSLLRSSLAREIYCTIFSGNKPWTKGSKARRRVDKVSGLRYVTATLACTATDTAAAATAAVAVAAVGGGCECSGGGGGGSDGVEHSWRTAVLAFVPSVRLGF